MSLYLRNPIEFKAHKFKNYMRENKYGLDSWVQDSIGFEKDWKVRDNTGIYPFYEYPISVEGFMLTHSEDGYILYEPEYFQNNFYMIPPPKKESLMYRLDELLWPDCAVCRSARAWVLISNAATNIGVMVGIYWLINALGKI